GKYVATANSSTQSACTTGNYCPATTVYYGKSGANGGGLNACSAPYSQSAASSDDANDCYLTTSPKKYVESVGAGEVSCLAGNYCEGGSVIYRGGTVSGRATTGGSVVCSANSYCPEAVSEPIACSTLGGGLYKNSVAGSDAAADCNFTTTGGYYLANATDTTQTKCEAKFYCSETTLNYPNVGGKESCPDPSSSTYKEAVSEIDWLVARCPDATTSNSSVVSSGYQTFSNTGLSAITQCPAIMTVSTPCSNFTIESARYNSTTGRYDSDKGNIYARSVKAGYYLTERLSSTYCTTNGQPNTKSMLYRKAVKCPENSYCPGGTVPVCNTGTYEESWGANACTTLGSFYTTSAEGATASSSCYGTTTAGNYVATATSGETTCAAGGYCPGSVKVNYNSTGGRTPCGAGKYNASTGSSAASACVACAIGSYAVGTGNTVCTACAAGTTTTATGHTSATCSACANNNDYDNSWSTPSWSANKVTNLCKISNCKAGSKYSSATGTNTTGSCTACAAGTYMSSSAHTNTVCTKAELGYYVSGTGKTAPTACTGATYADVEGLSECKTCPAATNNTVDVVSYSYWNTSSTAGDHTTRTGCNVTFKQKVMDTGTMASYSCYIDKNADTYGVDGTSKTCWVNKSSLKCAAGYYNTTFNNSSTATQYTSNKTLTNLFANVCVPAGDAYYSAADALTRTACPTADSGWTAATTTNTSDAYSDCYEYKSGASISANCAAGQLKREASSESAYSSNVTIASALKAVAGAYVNGQTCTLCEAGTYQATNGSTATSCSAVTSGCYGSAGATKACPTVCGDNKYSNSGASSCTACPTDYENSGTTAASHAGAASCKITVSDGYYIGTAGDNSSNWDKCVAGTAKASHTVAYGSTSSCGVCGDNNYSNAGASSCTACPTDYENSGTTAASHAGSASCKITVSGGYYIGTAGDNSSNWDKCVAGTAKASHTVAYGSTSSCGVCGDNNYSNAGASSCTACPTDYKNSGTTAASHAGSASCKITVSGGYYIGTAGDNSSNWDKCVAGTAKASHTVAYGSTSSCGVCANWSYSGAGASSCTSCPALASGWTKTDSTSTGWTTYTSCKQTQKPANCASGGITQTATSSTQWGASSVTTNLTANANYYVNGTACSACSGLASGFYPNSAAGNSGGASVCYGTTTAGKYVATANSSTQSACTTGNYCPATTVYYGKYGTNGGGLKVCSAPYSQSAASSDDANDCYLTTSPKKYVKSVGAGEVSCLAGNYCGGGSIIYKGGTVSGRATTGGSAVCSANSYCPEAVSEPIACSTLGGGLYKNSSAGSDAATDCYFTTTAGSYLEAATDTTQTTCPSGDYCPAKTLNYNSVGGNIDCPGSYTAGGTGLKAQSECKISVAGGKYVETAKSSTLSTCVAGTYKALHTVAYGGTSSCGVCADNKYSDAGASSCTACATDKGYANTGTTAASHAGVASCTTTCKGAQYVATAGAGCVTVGTGYYGEGGTVAQNAKLARVQCPENYRTGAAAAGISGCLAKCGAGTMVASANAACSTPNNTTYGASWYTAEHNVNYGSTSKSLSKVGSCPTSYATTNNTTATSHDARSDCMITCAAGKVVAGVDAACTTPSGSWYSAQHTVAAGGTSGTYKKSCLANYATPSTTTQTDHDNSTDCTISCEAGTQIATANATTCTTPSGNWYVGANTVKQGSVSTVNTCAVGENLFNANSYDSLWGYISASVTSVSSYATNAIVWVPVEPNTTYIISGMRGANTVTMANSAVEPAVGVTYTNFFDPGVKGKGALYTTSSDANYLILMGLRDADGSTTATRQAILDKNVANLQIFKANSGYGIVGNTATEHDTVSDCMIYCGAGEYVAVAGGACENVGAGYYGAGGTVAQGSISKNRGQCTAPLTTIGYGYGANEAEDCGRKLHAGSEVVYLRSAPRTSPALNVKVGDKVFYGAMSTALTGKLKVKDIDNKTYSVVNDYQ
ncbi:MAG: hypothetical protein IKL14_03710, partial [Alphaproteobacteria bacterium]|nr:hypothetical protein [Alphaproteobacteria bacterium]